MEANVYVLVGRTETSFDVYMACGTAAEAIEYHRKVTGLPGEITEETYREGHQVLTLDGGRERWGMVSQYKVGISEVRERSQEG